MTSAQTKTGLGLRSALIVFAVSGPVVFAIYLLGDVPRAIAEVALYATPVMFLFGAIAFVGSRRLGRAATILCVLSSLVWGVYLCGILFVSIWISIRGPLSSARNSVELLGRAFEVIALMYPFYAVITLLFVLAIIATLWLGLKLWIPDY